MSYIRLMSSYFYTENGEIDVCVVHTWSKPILQKW